MVFKIFNILILLLLSYVLKAQAIKEENSSYQNVFIKKGMVTTLSFKENINYFLMGDELIFQAQKVNNHTLMLYPLISNESTNLNVATDNYNYVFKINTLEYNSSKEPNLHINVLKPEDKFQRPKKTKNVRNPNYDYKYSMYTKYSKWTKFLPFWNNGRKIAPKLVWTDGTFTYLSYAREDGTSADIPTVLEVISDIDTPVNYTIKDNVIIVHAVSKKLTLKSGKYYVCIEYTGRKYETNQ